MASVESFCLGAKKQVAQISIEDNCCLLAQTYAMLLFSRLLSEEKNEFKTEQLAVARCIAELTAACCGIYAQITEPTKYGGLVLYTVTIPEESHRRKVMEMFGADDNHIHRELLHKDCCADAFLRGAFLVSASISDPDKGYHLEFCLHKEELADELCALLSERGLSFRKSARRNTYLVYTKDSDIIESLLGAVGAGNAYFELMSLKIYRNMRNNSNRARNCDDANTTKTVAAAVSQREAINLISEKMGLENLPSELMQIARLRLDNPEMSLRELGEILTPPLSRSGVNHRFKRLMDIAEELREKDRS